MSERYEGDRNLGQKERALTDDPANPQNRTGTGVRNGDQQRPASSETGEKIPNEIREKLQEAWNQSFTNPAENEGKNQMTWNRNYKREVGAWIFWNKENHKIEFSALICGDIFMKSADTVLEDEKLENEYNRFRKRIKNKSLIVISYLHTHPFQEKDTEGACSEPTGKDEDILNRYKFIEDVSMFDSGYLAVWNKDKTKVEFKKFPLNKRIAERTKPDNA